MDFVRVLIVGSQKKERQLYKEMLLNMHLPNYKVFDATPSLLKKGAKLLFVDYDCIVLMQGVLAKNPNIEKLFTEREIQKNMPALVCFVKEEEHVDLSSHFHVVTDCDYLVMSRTTHENFPQAIIHSVEKSILRKKIIEQQKNLLHVSNYDPMTQLPNRKFFELELANALLIARKSKQPVTILFFDIDNFKSINEFYGHSKGNLLLRSLAERLLPNIRQRDTLTYLGGDEFGFILRDYKNYNDVAIFADRIINLLHTPFFIENCKIYLTASIGISSYPENGKSMEELMKQAEIALYHAKEIHGNVYQFFSNDMHEKVHDVLSMKDALFSAIEKEEFFLCYQPKYNLISHQVSGFEVFIRWKQQDEIIQPSKFIAIAEQFGLILPIGYWVIDKVCKDCKFWKKKGIKARIAVNLSARQLSDHQFIMRLNEILAKNKTSPEAIEFELTESVLMTNPEIAIGILHELKNMGFALSIDDFGKGYSSLSYIKYLPVDRVKIDQMFIDDICIDPQDRAIVVTVLTLGNSLGLDVIAEGIENQDQLKALLELGCTEGQGYYLCKPMEKERLAKMLLLKKDNHFR